MACVYLLAIDPPYEGRRHYIGMTREDTPDIRLGQHLRKKSKFTAKCVKAGSDLWVIKFWGGLSEATAFAFERFLKDGRDTKYWCPHCSESNGPFKKREPYIHQGAMCRE